MKCSPRMEAVRHLKKAAKKLIADGYGDDEDAGEKLMAASKSGKLSKVEAEEYDDHDEDEAEEKVDMSELEEEALDFLGRGSRESPMAAGQTRVVFQIESPRKGRRGKA